MQGEVRNHETGQFTGPARRKPTLIDEVRAGSRIPLIIRRGLTTMRLTRPAAQRVMPSGEDVAEAIAASRWRRKW